MKPPAEYHNNDFQDQLIRTGSREDIIQWLMWNDPNGTYTDADCAVEGMPRLSLDEARTLMRSQVTRDRVDD